MLLFPAVLTNPMLVVTLSGRYGAGVWAAAGAADTARSRINSASGLRTVRWRAAETTNSSGLGVNVADLGALLASHGGASYHMPPHGRGARTPNGAGWCVPQEDLPCRPPQAASQLVRWPLPPYWRCSPSAARPRRPRRPWPP